MHCCPRASVAQCLARSATAAALGCPRSPPVAFTHPLVHLQHLGRCSCHHHAKAFPLAAAFLCPLAWPRTSQRNETSSFLVLTCPTSIGLCRTCSVRPYRLEPSPRVASHLTLSRWCWSVSNFTRPFIHSPLSWPSCESELSPCPSCLVARLTTRLPPRPALVLLRVGGNPDSRVLALSTGAPRARRTGCWVRPPTSPTPLRFSAGRSPLD